MKSNKLFLFLILLILLSSLVSSQNDNLPIGLKKIIEYNKSHTQDFAFKVSLFIAFLAGTLGILSPCILPFLPVYFALTFKEKVNITKMTIIFFLGFSLVFVSMGIIAGMIGSQVLSVLQKDWVIILAGLFLISMGLLSFFGKGFSSIIKPRARIKNDKLGIFLLGLFFALGWTACLGPILAGILGIGAILGDISKSAILLFFYSIGNFVPLFLISILYDKINFEKFISKFKPYKINIGNKKLYLNPINMLSGILIIILGLIFIIFKGTSIFNNADIFKTKQYFYLFQNKLLLFKFANIIGLGTFLLLIVLVTYTMFKKRSVQQKYDLFSKIYDTLEWPLEKFLFSKWRKKVITKFKGKVLEVGVGTGKNLQYYNDDVNVVGIDISQKMLNKAIDRSKNLKNVSLLKMDAQDLKFKDNTFDIVFCTFVLCSVPDPVKTLKEMKRVCKPGGKLVMIEHVKSKNWLVWLFQKIHNPFTFYLFGFNIDRDTIGNIKKAGLTITKDKKLALFDVFRQIEATCK